MVDRAQPQLRRDLDQRQPVVEINCLLRRDLRLIDREAENSWIRLAQPYIAGCHEEVDDRRQTERADAIVVQLPALVAYRHHFEPAPRLPLPHQLDHFGKWFRLRESERFKIVPAKVTLLIKQNEIEIFIEGQLPDFEGVEGES